MLGGDFLMALNIGFRNNDCKFYFFNHVVFSRGLDDQFSSLNGIRAELKFDGVAHFFIQLSQIFSFQNGPFDLLSIPDEGIFSCQKKIDGFSYAQPGPLSVVRFISGRFFPLFSRNMNIG